MCSRMYSVSNANPHPDSMILAPSFTLILTLTLTLTLALTLNLLWQL